MGFGNFKLSSKIMAPSRSSFILKLRNQFLASHTLVFCQNWADINREPDTMAEDTRAKDTRAKDSRAKDSRVEIPGG